jgi:exodeoxyribonuclease V alpha subunit
VVAVHDGPVADGPLGELVAAVRGGTLPPVPVDPQRRVVIVPAGDAAEAAYRVVQLVTDSIPRAFGLAPGAVAVLTPLQRGAAGARALNAALKARVNPGPGAFGGFDPGDRVVAPSGEIGVVTGPAGEDGLAVDGLGAVPRHRLRPGWALTVVRAAGGRWPAVVAVFPPDAGGLLGRPLALTAFTRAERHLSVVHAAGPALVRAVRDVAVPRPRRTRLGALLAQPTST